MDKEKENISRDSMEGEAAESLGEIKEERIDETEELIEESGADMPEEFLEKSIKESIKTFITKHKTIFTGGLITLGVLLMIYFGMAMYFINHFHFGTKINDIDVSGKTLEDTYEILMSELETYILTLKEREDKTEEIKGNEVGLTYSSLEKVEEFKENQSPFKWIVAFLDKDSSKLTIEFSYDNILLQERMDELSCFDPNNVIEPKNPSFEYKNKQYIIMDEVLGNKVDKDTLHSKIIDAIKNRKTEIELDAENCYIEPQYYADSKETIAIKDKLNKYVSSEIIYDFADRKETLDGSTIHNWLSVSEEFEVIMDEEQIRNYINELSTSYNTIGKTRDFKASSGKTIKIGGGDYGWYIHRDKEIEHLISDIKEGKTLTREPEYSQKAFSRGINDIGDTYVEIDLAGQHMWFYKNGSLITHGDVVTGNVQKNHTTPPGVFRLKYKSRNVVLRGSGYASPVTYWMPFNGGIGIHDASWRNTFGGNIYKTNGSHGCINSPHNVAKAIFENIEPETPVICY